jgi:hypothetical protein
MKLKYLTLSLIFGLIFSGKASDQMFFRVSSDQQTRITSFTIDGNIAWTNSIPGSTCKIEWSQSLNGPWLSKYFTSINCSGLTGAVAVPSVFKNGTANTIIFKTLNKTVSISPSGTTVDLNDDGSAELTFKNDMYNSGGFPSYSALGFFVELHNTKVASTPRSAGYAINQYTSFENSSSVLLYAYSPEGGPWKNTSQGFMPVQFQANGETYYGWVNLRIDPPPPFGFSPSMVIVSCAYEAIPSEPINANEQ